MIYIVTFNPALDYIFTVPNFKLGSTNRTAKEQLFPGGKGVNVSSVLRNLGIDSGALGVHCRIHRRCTVQGTRRDEDRYGFHQA